MSNSHQLSSAEVKHGFCASSFVVVRLEDQKEVAALKADLVTFYKPVNSQELLALERMASSQQQMLRGARLEAGLFASALDEVLDHAGDPIRSISADLAGGGEIEIARAQNPAVAAGEGLRRITKESNLWALLIRFQTHAERQYRRALEEFDRLKKLRPELPNEPNIEPDPKRPKTCSWNSLRSRLHGRRERLQTLRRRSNLLPRPYRTLKAQRRRRFHLRRCLMPFCRSLPAFLSS